MYLGVGETQTSHAAAAAAATRFGVDGAEFLFNGAEVGHEGVEIHVLPLIQRLCRRRDNRHMRQTHHITLELLKSACVFLCMCVYLSLTVDVVDRESVREVGHVGLLSEGSFLLRRPLRAAVIQTLDREGGKKV